AIAASTAGCSRSGERSWESFASSQTASPPRCSRRIVRPMRASRSMGARSWSTAPGVILGSLTALNLLNYLDRYVSAATLPLILSDLASPDAQGGLLQSLFIVAYALASGPAGWLGDAGKRLRIVATGVFIWSVATVASGLAPTYGWLLLARAVIGIGEASHPIVTPSPPPHCYPAGRPAPLPGVFYAAPPPRLAPARTPGRLLRGRSAGGCPRVLASPVGRADARGSGQRARRGHAARPGPVAPRPREPPELSRQHGGADHLHLQYGRPGDVDADLLRAGARHPAGERGVDVRRAPRRRRLRRDPGRRAPVFGGGATIRRRRFHRRRLVARRLDRLHAVRPAGAGADRVLAGHVRHAAADLHQHRAGERGHGQRAAGRAPRARLRGNVRSDTPARRRRITVAHRLFLGPSGAPRAGPHDWIAPGRGRRDSARRPGSSRERPRGGTGPPVEL